MSRSHNRAMLSPRNQSTESHLGDGRPPRHPPMERNESGNVEMGIIGTSRPRQRRGLCKGMGSQYSSTTSLYSQILENSRGMAYKSDSMISLRERLLKNQESWDQLLSDDPPKTLKERGSQMDLSKLGLSSTEVVRSELSKANHEVLRSNAEKMGKLCELGQALEKMMAGLDGKTKITEPLRVDTVMDDSSTRCGVNGLAADNEKKVFPSTRRFASPDSHDSAVEMDNASLLSNHSSDNTHLNGSNPAERKPLDQKEANFNRVTDVPNVSVLTSVHEELKASLPPQAPSLVERPSRARCRTPKLRSRGASPLLHSEPSSLNSSINGDLTPRSTLLSPDQGILSSGSTTWSVQQKHGSDHCGHSKGEGDSVCVRERVAIFNKFDFPLELNYIKIVCQLIIPWPYIPQMRGVGVKVKCSLHNFL